MMQRAISQNVTGAHIKSQARRVTPGHGTGIEGEAVNDDTFERANTPLLLVISVLANVVGGTLLLSGLFVLPHIIAGIFT